MSLLETILVAVLLALAGLSGYYIWQLRRSRDRLRQRLIQAPVGIIWTCGPRVSATKLARELLELEEINSLDDLLTAFSQEHQEIFDPSLASLRTMGESFSLTLDSQSGNSTLNLEGRANSRGDITIWIDDATTTAWLSEAYADSERENSFFKSLFDLLPMPIWWRDEDLSLIGCNQAFADMLELQKDKVIESQKELGSGSITDKGQALARRARKSAEPQSESHYVVLNANRRLLDFTEASIGPGRSRIGGFAVDVTNLEEMQSTLAMHLAAHDQVLENLATAIAVFGTDKRLKFFNEAYLKLWRLSASQLNGNPGYGEILELLRAQRQLPEIVDFPAYKHEQESKFIKLIEPEEELLHLPDERTIRVVTTPHPFGGLMLVFEDVTNRLALERSYNTLIAVQQATLNNLFEGVAVWGRDGRLRIWNEPFVQMWGYHENFLKRGPHISEMLDFTRSRWFPKIDDEEWASQKQSLILHFTEPKPLTRRVTRVDGHVINVAHVPLPDAQCLVLYSDVTDTVRVERALEERNAAFEKADLLKSQFIANVSYELRTPLNAIQGFSSILKSEYYGELNPRQMDHVTHILDASDTLMNLINDILDLATIQAGFLELECEEVPVCDILDQAVHQVEMRNGQSHLVINRVKKDETGSAEGTFHCDGGRLSRAISNILETMVSFAPRNQIDVDVEHIEDRLRLVFAGQYGPDREEDRELLIRRFTGNDPHALRTGAGLSLALAKSLIDLHQGEVSLDTDHAGGFAVICDLKSIQAIAGQLTVAEAHGQG
ncbi:PAS-domain containing protein [Aestuariispira insulae]|uniref:histidine kinase n=1 Tax=Aestuariispira insulae TaxID=1461337 RepID=A0A3D9HR95_9PROT|nr:PAS-domain containing protein [Aestuariispira insulae]RED51406.1 signal transduction histidine kinase [Aestuariispira insulae]